MSFQQRPQQGGRQEAMTKTPRFGEILDIAYSQHGLKEVRTEIKQYPTEDNKWTTIVHAQVITDRGVFQAIGDANPENAGRMIAPHSIRFAESRAIARALRWATNAGEAIDVEMGDYHPESARRVDTDGVIHETVRSGAAPVRTGTVPPAVATPPPTAQPAATRRPGLADLWKRAENGRAAIQKYDPRAAPMLPPADAAEAELVQYVEDAEMIFRSVRDRMPKEQTT